MVMYAWELFINILEVSLFFFFSSKKFQKKVFKYREIYIIFSFLFFTLLLSALNYFSVTSIINVIVFFFLRFLYVYIFYSNSLTSKCIYVALFCLAILLSDTLTILIPSYLFHVKVEDLLPMGNLRYPGTLIYISILAFFTFLLLIPNSKNLHLKKRESLFFLGLSVLFIGIEQSLYLELSTSKEFVSLEDSYVLFIVFYLVILLYVALILYMYFLYREREKNTQLQQEILVNNLEKQQYELVLSATEQLRIFRHDIRNHLGTLNQMMNRNDNLAARSYIQEINENFEHTYLIASSGNLPIDCIVTMKMNDAIKNAIDFKYTLHIPQGVPCSDYELCSLLGNLLDNALAACKKVLHETLIECNISPYKNMMMINVANSYNEKTSFSLNGDCLSGTRSKSIDDSLYHGIGLRRVHEIAEKYHGFVEITPRDGIFQVTVFLPLIQDNTQTTGKDISKNDN